MPHLDLDFGIGKKFLKNSIPRKTRFLDKINSSKNSISRKPRFVEKLNFPKNLIPRKTRFPEKLDSPNNSIKQKTRFLEKCDTSKSSIPRKSQNFQNLISWRKTLSTPAWIKSNDGLMIFVSRNKIIK